MIYKTFLFKDNKYVLRKLGKGQGKDQKLFQATEDLIK